MSCLGPGEEQRRPRRASSRRNSYAQRNRKQFRPWQRPRAAGGL